MISNAICKKSTKFYFTTFTELSFGPDKISDLKLRLKLASQVPNYSELKVLERFEIKLTVTFHLKVTNGRSK